MSSVELNRTDLAVLFCLCNYRNRELEKLANAGYTPDEAAGMVHKLGIVRLLEDNIVNEFIEKYSLGQPLHHSTQFYRIADKLAAAELIVGKHKGEYYFAPRLAGKRLVAEELQDVRPSKWPSVIEVEAGKIVARLNAR